MPTLTRIQFDRALTLALHYHHWWSCIGRRTIDSPTTNAEEIAAAKALVTQGYRDNAIEVERIHDLARLVSRKEGPPIVVVGDVLTWSTSTKRLAWWVNADGSLLIEVYRPLHTPGAPTQGQLVAKAHLTPFNKLTVERVEDREIEARHVQALEEAVSAVLADGNFHRKEFAPLWAAVVDFDVVVERLIELGREHAEACLSPVEHTKDGRFSTAISVTEATARLSRLWGRIAFMHEARNARAMSVT